MSRYIYHNFSNYNNLRVIYIVLMQRMTGTLIDSSDHTLHAHSPGAQLLGQSEGGLLFSILRESQYIASSSV